MDIRHTVSQGFEFKGHFVCADQVARLAGGAPYVRSKSGKKVTATAEERAEIQEFLKGYKARAAVALGQINRLAMYG